MPLPLPVLLAAATQASTNATVLYFQSAAGAPLEAKALDMAEGRWQRVWIRPSPTPKARAISVASLGERVAVLWSIGDRKRYSEVRATNGRRLGTDRDVSPTSEAILAAGGRPLLLDSGGDPHLFGASARRGRPAVTGSQARGRRTRAAGTPDGRYVLSAYSEARAGSSFSLLNVYRIGRGVRPSMPTDHLSPGVHDVAVCGSVAAVARGTADVELYRIGRSGLRRLGAATIQPPIYALFPSRDGGFYGLTERTVVALRPQAGRWGRTAVASLDFGDVPEARLIETPGYVAVIVPGTAYRMRRDRSGALSLVARSPLPPGWIP